MKTLRRLFSPDAVRQVLYGVARRFSYPLVFISALVVWLIIWVYDFMVDYHVVVDSMSWALFEGFLLSLAVSLWCEFMGWKKAGSRAQICILVLVAFDFIVLCMRGGVSGSAEFTGRVAFTVALGIAIFFLPAVKRLYAKQLWSYTVWQLSAAAVAAFIGAVLAISCVIIFTSVNMLFGLDVFKPMYNALFLLGIWVPVVIFLSRVPHYEDITSGNLDHSSVVGAFCKNVILPLVCIYIIILYVYAAKILFTWKLPQASITWMVAGLMCAALIMLYGLQRYSFGGSVAPAALKIWSLVRRLMPLVLLPLLVLMSVGLLYRVGEYGVTVSRLYVAAFNLWAYVVVIYLVFKREANLNLIAASFAVVFALVSVIPGLNFTSIADRVIRMEVINTLRDNGVESFPITGEKLTEMLSVMNRKDAENLASRVEYLDDWEDHSRVSDIVKADDKLAMWRILPESFKDDAEVVTLPFIFEYTEAVAIPEGFSKVYKKTSYGSKRLEVDSCGFAVVEYDGYSVKLNVDSLLSIKESDMPMVFNAENGSGEKSCFVFTALQIENDSVPMIIRPQYYIFTR